MTLDEVAALFVRSRRTIMRWVETGKLPPPVETEPLSFNAVAIKNARKRITWEAKHGRKYRGERNGRRRHKPEGGNVARS